MTLMWVHMYVLRRYGGHWENGLEHGHGVYSYASGARFDGQHVEGQREGDGTLTLRDGSQLKATWVRGEVRAIPYPSPYSPRHPAFAI
jgi:hypothetical protein